MILECPACQNRYLVDPRALGAQGRRVRCAKCRHEWFAEPGAQPQDDVLSPPVDEATESTRADADKATDATAHSDATATQTSATDSATTQTAAGATPPRSASVPALFERRDAPLPLLLLTGLAALFFLACVWVSAHAPIMRAIPATEPLYAAMGIYTTEGVVLADLEYSKAPPETDNALRDTHIFSGYVVNTSAHPRRLPHTLITLKGRENAELRRRRLVEKTWLQPGETKRFRVALHTSPESLRHVVIELGSPFELKLR